jgi:hypothetical protein
MGGRVPGGNYTRTPLREKYPVMENFTAEGSAWLKFLIVSKKKKNSETTIWFAIASDIRRKTLNRIIGKQTINDP